MQHELNASRLNMKSCIWSSREQRRKKKGTTGNGTAALKLEILEVVKWEVTLPH